MTRFKEDIFFLFGKDNLKVYALNMMFLVFLLTVMNVVIG